MADYEDTRGMIDEQRQLTGGVITIRIPAGGQNFTVHKNMTARRSKYFRSKLMLEPTRTIFDLTITDLTEETLHTYVQYLYSGNIQCQGSAEGADREESDCRSRMIDFYGLAAQLDDGGAMDAAISSMIASIDQGDVPDTETGKKAYAVAKPADNLAAASRCDYHEHSKDAPCISKKRKRADEDNESENEDEGDGEDEESKEGTPMAKKFKALQDQVEELKKKLKDLGEDE